MAHSTKWVESEDNKKGALNRVPVLLVVYTSHH